jgi:hypothetical protein
MPAYHSLAAVRHTLSWIILRAANATLEHLNECWFIVNDSALAMDPLMDPRNMFLWDV